MSSVQEALRRLREGNHRFVAGERKDHQAVARRAELVESQQPFAVVLGCSDSRVPVETVFDQGVGDLFVIRVAGNVVTPTQTGSVEFAVNALNVRLVIVLGHTNCGAVRATLNALNSGSELSPGLNAIVEQIAPAVEAVKRTRDSDDLVERAVHVNVRRSVASLRSGSTILQDRVNSGDVVVLGAVYSLESGVVDFLEDVPD